MKLILINFCVYSKIELKEVKNYVNKEGKIDENTIHTYIHTYTHTYNTLKNENRNKIKEEKIVKTVKKENQNIIKPVLEYG